MNAPARRNGSDLLVTRYGGQVMVLDRAASTYHHLNPLTTFVWERCDGATSRTALAREVARAFETDSAEELVGAALERLGSAGLLADALARDLGSSRGAPSSPAG